MCYIVQEFASVRNIPNKINKNASTLKKKTPFNTFIYDLDALYASARKES